MGFSDGKMPFLADAVDRLRVEECFGRCLAIAANCRVQTVQVIRHKLGRRCLIEYELINDDGQIITLIGKVRAKGTDFHSYELQKSLWSEGFGDDSPDGISVPEPVGVIPEWQMWLQRKVEGVIATQFLSQTDSILPLKLIAEAAHKLHQANIPPRRSHTMSDELRILHERIPLVTQQYPQWEERLERILEASNHLGENTPEIKHCGIHRDFYPDQVIINNSRLYLIDLDLYCEGNPALDIGNFIAHIQEYSLRTFGNSQALQEYENVLTERFIQLTSDEFLTAIQSYATLTLVRHIYISTQFPERRPFTEALLNLCEQRLGIIRNS
ncbi:MAG: phosphotransferase family protein [Nostoc sp. EfeVER01]|uniref:phosphotransferase family protein n=1 Tax=unclassified Nostoc TaxID=2593658 RepID=UPI002AD25F1A|nr:MULTISPECIES: phosphotransferase [unclassified Nostoc]MDZ7948034.1 phosphotransferase [Nostoc sp. EfeVER01]MDZ7995958.1 phosphotransferase [Nostoc sp. EspVER01]